MAEWVQFVNCFEGREGVGEWGGRVDLWTCLKQAEEAEGRLVVVSVQLRLQLRGRWQAYGQL